MLVFKKINPDLKCARCGCDDVRFLEINHKYGGGTKEVRSSKRTIHYLVFYYNRPTNDLELVCRPCNHIHYLEMKFGEKIPLRVVYEKPMEVICN